MARCIDVMRSVLSALVRGEVILPLRRYLSLPNAAGALGAMPGCDTAAGALGLGSPSSPACARQNGAWTASSERRTSSARTSALVRWGSSRWCGVRTGTPTRRARRRRPIIGTAVAPILRWMPLAFGILAFLTATILDGVMMRLFIAPWLRMNERMTGGPVKLPRFLAAMLQQRWMRSAYHLAVAAVLLAGWWYLGTPDGAQRAAFAMRTP